MFLSVFFFNSATTRLLLAILPWLLGNLDPAIFTGEEYFRLGLYEEAITEYQRYLFFHAHDPQNIFGYVYYRMGITYRNQGLWNEAITALEKSIQSETDDLSRERRRLDLGVTLIACRRHSQAEFLLLKLELYSPFLEIRRYASLYRGLSCLYEEKWTEAQEAFKSFCDIDQDPSMAEAKVRIRMIIRDMEYTRLKSAKLAKALSTILPGAGQIYSKELPSGLNALLINAATFYLVLSDALNQRYFDALFNLIFLFERFYSGNRHNAGQAAQQYNRRQSEQIIDKILKIFDESRSHPCPIS